MKQVELTQGKFALVDDEDYDLVMQYSWHAHLAHNGKLWYAIHSVTANLKWPLHRFVVGLHEQTDPFIDHKDRDGLNCQKHNLREATQRQNVYNSGPKGDGYKGVIWSPDRQMYRAKIALDGKNKYLGQYQTAEEAAKAYDAEAKLQWGDFAYQNFPEEV